MVYRRILNMVSCAGQWDLIVYPSYMEELPSAHPKLPIHPSLPQLPFGNPMSVPTSVNLFCGYVPLCPTLDSTYKRNLTVFVFLWLYHLWVHYVATELILCSWPRSIPPCMCVCVCVCVCVYAPPVLSMSWLL